MKCALLMILSVGGWAQSLQILPSPPFRAAGSFQIMLVSPKTKEPVALQWRLSVSNGITLNISDIAVGSAAESAQKTITCASVRDEQQQNNESTYACILAGGQRPIPNGSLATVRVTVRPGLRAGKVLLRGAIGVLPDMTQVDFPDAEGEITAK